MSAQLELAKAIIRNVESTEVEDEGVKYLVYTLGDVSVTLNNESKHLVGMNIAVGPLDLTYTDGSFVILDEDEASEITSEELIAKITEHLNWRRSLLENFGI